MAVSRMPKGNPIPIDPNVIVPEAVRRSAAAADTLQKETYPEQTSANVDPNAPPQHKTPGEQEQIKIIEAEAAPRLPSVVTTVQAMEQQKEQAREQPKEQPKPQAPAPQEPSPDDESWRVKYEAQLGRVRQLTNQNKELGDRIGTLENLMESVRATPAPAPQATPQRLISEKEEEDFGPEMIDVMRRAAKEVATPLLDEISSLRSQLGNTTATITQRGRQAMLEGLGRDLPDWKEINVAPEFHAWLALPDAFSGVTRKSLLQAAYDKNETSRVLTFFKSFISELAATTPAESAQTPVATNGQGNARPSRPTLGDLAAPGRARTAASSALPAEKPIIRTSDINALYAAKRKGLYNGREAEFAEYERELGLAQREGRIVRDT